jgi:hypothetical protein
MAWAVFEAPLLEAQLRQDRDSGSMPCGLASSQRPASLSCLFQYKVKRMKIATATQILTAQLSQLRVVTKKNGDPRCESNTIYNRTTQTKDGRLWITLSSVEGDATIVVDDNDAPIVDSEDPSGPYTHTVYLRSIEPKMVVYEWDDLLLRFHELTQTQYSRNGLNNCRWDELPVVEVKLPTTHEDSSVMQGESKYSFQMTSALDYVDDPSDPFAEAETVDYQGHEYRIIKPAAMIAYLVYAGEIQDVEAMYYHWW